MDMPQALVHQRLHPTRLVLTLLAFIALSLASTLSHASGHWTKKSFAIQGSWSIVERNGSHVLTLDENFKTRSAPDLKIFLSRAPLSSLRGSNATSQSILISPLQSNRGAQEYVLPSGIDITQFQSLIIHCEAYSKLWGGASL